MRLNKKAFAYTVKTASPEAFCEEYIEERATEIAYYIIETGATVRQTARKFKVSKSTVHKDLRERLNTDQIRLWQRRPERCWQSIRQSGISAVDWLREKSIFTGKR